MKENEIPLRSKRITMVLQHSALLAWLSLCVGLCVLADVCAL
jgi:hypothetical protein